ncbi:nuclear transport factor 2 family protein [Chloroflexota bacterium]
MKADAKTGSAVIAVLNKFTEAYAKRDMDGLLALFASDPDVVLMGTGVDEKRTGLQEIKAQAERDWAQAEAVSFDLSGCSVSASGPIAWVVADSIANVKIGGKEASLAGRFTAVLEKRGDSWLIMQSHGSMPAAEQAAGESYPA